MQINQFPIVRTRERHLVFFFKVARLDFLGLILPKFEH